MNETNAEQTELQIKALEIIAEHRGQHGDKTVEADIIGAVATIRNQSARIAELERRVEELEQELSQRPYCVCKFTDPEPNRFGCAKASDLIWTTRCSLHNGFVAPIESELSQLRAEVERLKKERDEDADAEECALCKQYAEGVATLQRERDEARAEREKVKFDYEHDTRVLLFDEKWKELQSLRAQLAEREEDRALLDTIIELGFVNYNPNRDEWDVIGKRGTFKGKTFRAAIRAARAQPEEKA